MWAVGGLAVLVALLLVGLAGRKSVHAERVIPHPAPAIWALVTDAAGYEDWNPILVHAEGRFEEGATMRYRMRTANGDTTPVETLVRRFVLEREINQFGGMRGVLTFSHTWQLEPAAGGTRVIQHEEYRGIGVWFWSPAWVEAAYHDGLLALERRLAIPP